MKKLLLVLATMLLGPSMDAQELKVLDSITPQPSRNEATTYRRTDLNGNVCALLILDFDDDNIWFEGTAGKDQFKSGQWWIWFAPGASWLTVRSNNYIPLRIDFTPVETGVTYTMKIGRPHENYVLVVTDLLHADISMLDATRYNEKDSKGRNCALLRIGLVEPDATFTSRRGKVHKNIYQGGEWWVWMEEGSTNLTITTPTCDPLDVKFEALGSSVTYLMTINKLMSDSDAIEKLKREAKQLEALRQAEAERIKKQQEEEAARLAAAQKKREEEESRIAALKKEREKEEALLANTKQKASTTSANANIVKPIKSTKKYNDNNTVAFVESMFIPGLGQWCKGYPGHGMANMVLEGLLIGGTIYSYNEAIANREIILENKSVNTEHLNAYNNYVYSYYGCICASIAVYAYNLVQAVVLSPKSSNLSMYPTLIPTGNSMATGVGLSFKF